MSLAFAIFLTYGVAMVPRNALGAKPFRKWDSHDGVSPRSVDHAAMRASSEAVVRKVAVDKKDQIEEQRTRNALFIQSGKMRNYKNLWPAWEKNFIKPSQKAGVQFTMAVATDLRAWCDPNADDAFRPENRKNPTANGCACMRLDERKCSPFMQNATPASKARFKGELHATFGPVSKGGAVHIVDAESAEGGHGGHSYGRALPLLKKFENETFDYIIVVRPDIVLADSHNFSWNGDREFNLVSLCDSHPGLNVISGAFIRNNDDVHHRDWDWGYMLCDGRNVDKARAVLFDQVGPCDKRDQLAKAAGKQCVPPRRSPDWRGNGNYSCGSRACTWFEGMEGKMRLGNLDDTLFGMWPPKSNGRDVGQDPYKPL